MAPRPLPRSVRFAISSALVALLVAACATGTPVKDSGSGGGTTTTGGAEVCRLHSCDSNRECGACTEGNQTCLLAEHRCVACDPLVGGCPDGAFCSEFGACVPQGQTCITNDNGIPTITCASDADCLACDSLHHVCDPQSSRCVTCTDADVSACGGPSACNENRCAECSPTVACPDGKICVAGGRCDVTTGSTGVGGAGGGTSATSGSTGVGGAGGGSTGPCHEICQAGGTMAATCDPCVAKLCAADAFCCSTAWDPQCVSEVPQYCGATCPVTGGTGSTSSTGTGGAPCAHAVCTAGVALDAFCAPCATLVCTHDSYCCTTKWDASCVAEVTTYCSPGC
jgi:hypothetical protein